MDFLTFFIYYSISSMIMSLLYFIAIYFVEKYRSKRIEDKLNNLGLQIFKVDGKLNRDDGNTWH